MSNLKAYFEMDASHQMAFRMGQAFEQDQTQPVTLEQTPLTLTDLVEVAESMGGEVVEAYHEGAAVIHVEPGRYLVIPLEETQK